MVPHFRVTMRRRALMNDNVSMQDPIAFFITWPTYGTWLPGNERGWVEYHHGWQLPNRQVAETCNFRAWTLYAVNCRSYHVHIVVGAFNTVPKKIRSDIKAWCTRRLKEQCDLQRSNWWAERGSIRYIWNEDSLATVIQYVMEGQNHNPNA